jgi:hypothetical protein
MEPERATRVYKLRREHGLGTCAMCSEAIFFGDMVAMTNRLRTVHASCLAARILYGIHPGPVFPSQEPQG